MHSRERLVRTHVRTNARKVSNLVDGRPTGGGCWLLAPSSLSSLRSNGQVKGRTREESIDTYTLDTRILFLKPSILFDIQESMMIEKHCRKYTLSLKR